MKPEIELQVLAFSLLLAYTPLLWVIESLTGHSEPWGLYALNSMTALPILLLVFKRAKVGGASLVLMLGLAGLDALVYLALTTTSYEPWLFKGL